MLFTTCVLRHNHYIALIKVILRKVLNTFTTLTRRAAENFNVPKGAGPIEAFGRIAKYGISINSPDQAYQASLLTGLSPEKTADIFSNLNTKIIASLADKARQEGLAQTPEEETSLLQGIIKERQKAQQEWDQKRDEALKAQEASSGYVR